MFEPVNIGFGANLWQAFDGSIMALADVKKGL